MTETLIELETDNKTEVRYIYHISDVHIRNGEERRQEYEEVFQHLFKKIAEQIDDNNENLIVVTGDILHHGIDSEPSAYALATNFFTGLLQIANVIVIAGNHDHNMNNINELDALSILFTKIGDQPTPFDKFMAIKGKPNNIYYLKSTGFYLFHNIIFSMTCMFDDEVLSLDKLDNQMQQNNIYKIALYHGFVQATTDGPIIPKFNIDHFRGYDYVLLGDIHKFRYVNDDKTIAYPGSLIQQNHGEKMHPHGYLRWDLLERKSDHHHIPNNYGFCTIKFVNGKMIEPDIPLPLNLDINVILENTSPSQYYLIMDKLMKKHNISAIEIIESNNGLCTISKLSGDYETQKSNDHHRKYIKELTKYMKSLGKNQDEINSVFEIHNKALKKFRKNVPNKKNWSIIELCFSNMLGYGENNVIDFTRFDRQKSIGIIGPNDCGKSSLVDIILYTLFGKWSRQGSIITNGCEDIKCSIKIMVGNHYYWIGRKKTSALSLHYAKDKGKRQNLTEGKIETQKKIVQIIGDYDMCVKTYICLQHRDDTDFFDFSREEKKKFLQKLLGLNVLQACQELSKDELSKLNADKKALGNQVQYYNMGSIEGHRLKLQKSWLDKNGQIQKYEFSEASCTLEKPQLMVYAELSNYNLSSERNIEKCIVDLKSKLSRGRNLKTITDCFDNYEMQAMQIGEEMDKVTNQNIKCLSDMLQLLADDNLCEVTGNVNEPKISQIIIEHLEWQITQLDSENDKIRERMERICGIYANGFNEVTKQLLSVKMSLAKHYMQIIDNRHFFPESELLNTLKLANEQIGFVQLNVNELNKVAKNIGDASICDDLIGLIKNGNDSIRQMTSLNTQIQTVIDNLTECDQNVVVLEKERNLIQYKLRDLAIEMFRCRDAAINEIDRNDELKNELKKLQLSHGSAVSFSEGIKKLCSYCNYMIGTVNSHVPKNQILNLVKLCEETKRYINKIVADNTVIERHLLLLEKYKQMYISHQQKLAKYEKINMIVLRQDSVERGLKHNARKKEKCESLLKDLDTVDEQWNLYTDYNSMIDTKSGLPCDIINVYTGRIQELINDVLEKFVDFHVELKFVKQTNKEAKSSKWIEAWVHDENRCSSMIESSSEFQKFIIGLACRVAFDQLFLHTRPNFFVIDDGWGCMDDANVSMVSRLIKYIKKLYDHVIAIGHVKMKTDYRIKIEKRGGFNYVNNTDGKKT